MGIFSLFSSSTKNNDKIIKAQKVTSNIRIEHLGKDFFMELIDNHDSMFLYYIEGDGWIGANKRFFEQLPYTTIEEFREKNDSIRDIFSSESEEIFTENDKSWLEYIKRYKPEGYRLEIQTAEDESPLVVDAICKTYHKNERLYILEFKDVTALHEANLKTKEVEKLKSKFLANIGHEFRTPMNGIMGFIDLLKETSLDKKQLEYINMINRSSKNLMSNIESLLDLVELQSGRLKLEAEEFNLLPLMENLANKVSLQSEDKGVRVFTFIDPKLPKELYGDSKKIVQIMKSLTSNAVKFTPRGGKIIIEVKLLKRAQNGDCSIGFGVKDNGKGISEEQIALIDEPFTAGNHADERLGIGLSLSSGLVKLFGSEFRIQSQKNSGTYVNFVLNFKRAVGQNYKMMPKRKVKILLLDQTKVDEANFLTIYLRSFAIDVVKSNLLDADVYKDIEALYIVADQDDSSWMLELGTYAKKRPVFLLLEKEQKLQTKLTHIVDDVIRKPLLPTNIAKHLYTIHSLEFEKVEKKSLQIKEKVRALVVEDNLINQRLIQILLQEYNVLVFTASNGLEAVNMCSRNKYDIVFMDIDMPQMNGIDATKEIKLSKTNIGIPIVALTAMAMEGDREMLLDEGLDDYISKPLTREKLEKVLNKYLKVTA